MSDINQRNKNSSNFIDEEKHDPSLALFQKDYSNFDVYNYIHENPNPVIDTNFEQDSTEEDFILKTECFYLTKFDQICGTFILKKECLVFQPDNNSQTNKDLINENVKIDDYRGVIDFMDVIEINKMNLVNEKAIVSDNAFIRDAYKFNLFIQIILTAVNGVTFCQSSSGQESDQQGAIIDEQNKNALIKRNEMPIANIYIKFCHKDKEDGENVSERVLTNKYEELVLDEIIRKFQDQISHCQK